MTQVNTGFLSLFRRRIDRLKEEKRPTRRQEELLHLAELALYRPPTDTSSDAISLLNLAIQKELGIKE